MQLFAFLFFVSLSYQGISQAFTERYRSIFVENEAKDSKDPKSTKSQYFKPEPPVTTYQSISDEILTYQKMLDSMLVVRSKLRDQEYLTEFNRIIKAKKKHKTSVSNYKLAYQSRYKRKSYRYASKMKTNHSRF